MKIDENKKLLNDMVDRFGLSNVLLQISEICNERSKEIKTKNIELSEAWFDAGGAIDMVAQINPNVRAVSDLILIVCIY